MERYKRVFPEESQLGEMGDNLRNILLEDTFDISEDVDFIYDVAFKPFFDNIRRYKINSSKMKEIYQNIVDNIPYEGCFEFKVLSSSSLKSDDCKQAHKNMPIKIKCGATYDNSYLVGKKEIIVGLPIEVIESLANDTYNYAIKKAKKIDGIFYKNLLSVDSIKASIAHELTHWLDDALHNQVFSRNITLDNDDVDDREKDIIKLKNKDVNMEYFEINAQIHGIKNLKSKKKQYWNEMTLRDVFIEYSSLRTIALKLYKNYGKEIMNLWQKYLTKRMEREKLLGDKMYSFATYEELTERKKPTKLRTYHW